MDAELTVAQYQIAATGRADITALVERARTLFPDLTYQPRTRGVGPNLVLDEGYATGTQSGGPDPTGLRLACVIKVTVHHDGTKVSRIAVALDQGAVDRALGVPVDAVTAIYSDIQALRADMHTGLDVRTLAPITVVAPAELSPSPANTGAARAPAPRRRWLIGPALLAAATIAVLAITLSRSVEPGPGQPESAPASTIANNTTGPASPTPHPTKTSKPKPAVVLSADLAFASNSAAVSPAARSRVLDLATRARELTGVIHVEGYTDNIGSIASGLTLSQARADAVAAILRTALQGQATPTVTAIGHGEADPVATNATAAGRAKNRRVTITLPAR